MEIYRVPCREVSVRLLVDGGQTLDGTLFTAETVAGRRVEDVLHHLNERDEDFLPLSCGGDSLVLNKAAILWVQLAESEAQEMESDAVSGRHVSVRLVLAGGLSVEGTLLIAMPRERSRVVDYLNAAGRFLPLFRKGTVTLVQRRSVVTVQSEEDAERS